jgi:hypothetical protein
MVLFDKVIVVVDSSIIFVKWKIKRLFDKVIVDSSIVFVNGQIGDKLKSL